MNQGSLYEELRDSGAKLDNHESDLYVKDSPEVRAIIVQHNFGYTAFRSQIDGNMWLDIPFA